jgi:hypothetical protein
LGSGTCCPRARNYDHYHPIFPHCQEKFSDFVNDHRSAFILYAALGPPSFYFPDSRFQAKTPVPANKAAGKSRFRHRYSFQGCGAANVKLVDLNGGRGRRLETSQEYRRA